MAERESKEGYESAGKRALLVLTRCKRLFLGDGMYIPARVMKSEADIPVIVGWAQDKGFCADMGEGEMILTNNPLDAPRLSAVLSAMNELYAEAKRLRDEYASILQHGADEAEAFLKEVTKDRKPDEDPPSWP